jgi:hypothetical protein
MTIANETPPEVRSAGPELNCNALDKQQFIDPEAATQAQNQRNPRVVAANNPIASRRRVRLQYLARRLHGLGERPLFHFLDEVERGAPLWPHLERYAALPGDFIKANGGDRFALIVHVIDGGEL